MFPCNHCLSGFCAKTFRRRLGRPPSIRSRLRRSTLLQPAKAGQEIRPTLDSTAGQRQKQQQTSSSRTAFASFLSPRTPITTAYAAATSVYFLAYALRRRLYYRDRYLQASERWSGCEMRRCTTGAQGGWGLLASQAPRPKLHRHVHHTRTKDEISGGEIFG